MSHLVEDSFEECEWDLSEIRKVYPAFEKGEFTFNSTVESSATVKVTDTINK